MCLKSFLKYSHLLYTKEVNVILDIGSLNCLEAIEISKSYPNAKIYAFECNPKSYIRCIENTKNKEKVTVVNKAVHNYDGKTKFFPTDPEKTVTTWPDGNPGASSLFKASGAYDHIEKYVQNEIEVDCTRIETWAKQNNIDEIDLVWMDLQGAELLALQGFGDLLKKVKLIHTEVEINPMYSGQALYKDIDPFLKSNNFSYVWGNLNVQFGTDVIYVNNELLKKI